MMEKISELMKQYKIDSLSLYDSTINEFQYFNEAKKESIYEAASLTKVVFAYLVLKLANKKIIDLDKSIKTYFQEYNFSFKSFENTNYEFISPRHLLSHSSGMENWSHKDILPLHFLPGTKFMYSGEGYELLQNIVTKVTNKSIDTLLDEYVFTPFKMNNSFICHNEKVEKHLINCYDKNLVLNQKDRRKLKPNVAYTLYTTIEDYQKFISGILLNSLIINQMFLKTTKINEHLSWGLGLANIDDKYYWQWGDNGNYKNFLWIDNVNKSYIIYFSNSYNGLNLICDYIKENYSTFEYVLPIIN